MWRLRKSLLGHRWTVLLALVVILPAVSLAILAVQNFRGEQLREAYRRQEYQRQIVRLLSADLQQAIRVLPTSRNGPALVFSIQNGGILIPELNASLDRPPPAFPEAPTSESDRRLQERWREARQRDSDTLLRQLAGRDSPFAALARLGLLRRSTLSGDPEEAAAWLELIRELDAEALTASGIPLHVAAAFLLIGEDRLAEADFLETLRPTAFLEETLRGLVEGRWELTISQWVYYTKAFIEASAEFPGIVGELDSPQVRRRILLLESALELFPHLPPMGREVASGRESPSETYYLAENEVVAAVFRDPEGHTGVLVPEGDLRALASSILEQLTQVEDFGGELRLRTPESAEPASVPGFPFWEIAFPERQRGGIFGSRAYLAVYGGGLLFLVTTAALIFTYRAISHEVKVTQLKADFVSSVSHEFRSPLAGMEALLERLESGRVTDAGMRDRYHKAIRRELRRLVQMVTELLDFARLEEGTKPFSFESVDLNQLTREVIQSFSNLGHGNRLELECAAAEGALTIRADRISVFHAVQNLVDNALKYSPQSSPVRVRAGARDGAAVLSVIDEGPGIAPPEQAKIFEPFYRVGGTAGKGPGGVGVGLTLVKRIMEGHGGRVALESGPGKGSRFDLIFPKNFEGGER